MDEPNRQRRQHNPPNQRTLSKSFGAQLSQPTPGTSSERLSTPISTSSHTPRSIESTGGYTTYYHGQTPTFPSANMPPADIAVYGPEYGQSGRQQPQSFGGYNTAAMMYNVAQSNTQPSVYDAQPFGSRQPAGVQMMHPDVASTYFGADAANAPPSSLHQSGSGSSTSIYQESPSLSYTSNMPGLGAVHQQSSADIHINDESSNSEDALKQKWQEYQRQLGTIFQDIKGGSLDAASETLIAISNWLLPQVAELGRCTEHDWGCKKCEWSGKVVQVPCI